MSKTVAKKECHICHWLFNRSSNLYKHLRRVHGIEPTIQYGTIRCPNPECVDKFRLYEKLRFHMTNFHGIVIKRTVHRFPSEEDFKEWKKIVELSMMCKYSIFSSKAIVSGGVMVYYKCNRSGYFESKSTGRKHYESMLMNGHCPSTMNVKICENRVKVLFYQTHYGHDFDIRYLSRSKRISVENAIKLLEDNPMDNNLYGLENSDDDSNSNESSSEIKEEMENKELKIKSEDTGSKDKETEDKEIQKSIKEIEKILNQDPEAVEYQSPEPINSNMSEDGPKDFQVSPPQLPVLNQSINHFYLNSEILPYKKVRLDIIKQEK